MEAKRFCSLTFFFMIFRRSGNIVGSGWWIKCKTVGVTHTSETMKPFAEACYNGLVEIVNSKAF